MAPTPDFVHRYVAGSSANGPTLLLLHGTGGDEEDLLPLGRALLPDANVLSPRGQVLEHGMPRFFRRLAEGVFDLEDLARRTDDLARFVAGAAAMYGFSTSRVVAVGYSNGANIAASVLLKVPGLLTRAILIRPMVPFTPASTPNLAGTEVLLSAGELDLIVPASQPRALADLLRNAGAEVEERWQRTGHGLVEADVAAAREWLAVHRP
jgi:phospholipase/carboxylesterase